jgi:UDP-N-acetylglucosamine--N-acetylmuramyl-(pentapeptide) pyrophosphoryl-undecaprenol N-acetylglucosamine transferase
MIAAGGTGGSVYPGLAAAQALIDQHPDVEIAFVGSVDGFERRLVEEAGVQFASYDEVRAGPLHGVSLPRQLLSLVNLGIGTLQALWLVKRRGVRALLLTGGWVGLPTALAAWLWRVPILIYLPDIEPGLTIQALRRFARRIALTVDESRPYFPFNETVVTGYPVRPELAAATRAAALAHFKLDPERKTLVVFGGSRGSRAINTALLDILPDILATKTQVIHITGTLDWPDIAARRKAMPDMHHYHAFPYLHRDMGLALAAADLVVSRAGAGVLGEFPFFGVASILVPLAYAWRYQQVNADYLANRGAAIHLDESRMKTQLWPIIRDLLNDPTRLAALRAQAAALGKRDGAARLAAELIQLAGGAA